MSRANRIEQLILHAETRLRAAKAEADKIRGELRELRARLDAARDEERQLSLPLDMRSRGISDKWAAVLNYMLVRMPNAVSIEEILAFAAENSLDISRASARAQLHNYVKRGILLRVADGLYLPTDQARVYCDY